MALNHCHQLQSDRAGNWKGLIHLDLRELSSHRRVFLRVPEPAHPPCPSRAPCPGSPCQGRRTGQGCGNWGDPNTGKGGPAQDTLQQSPGACWVYLPSVGHSVSGEISEESKENPWIQPLHALSDHESFLLCARVVDHTAESKGKSRLTTPNPPNPVHSTHIRTCHKAGRAV